MGKIIHAVTVNIFMLDDGDAFTYKGREFNMLEWCGKHKVCLCLNSKGKVITMPDDRIVTARQR